VKRLRHPEMAKTAKYSSTVRDLATSFSVIKIEKRWPKMMQYIG
jgi:hypothetical protein